MEIDFYERIKLTRLNDVACQIIRLLNGFFTPPADESWRVGKWRALKMMVLVTFFHIFSKRYIIATLAYCARGRCTGPSIIRTVLEIAAKPEMDHWFPTLISRKHKVTWMLESPPLSTTWNDNCLSFFGSIFKVPNVTNVGQNYICLCSGLKCPARLPLAWLHLNSFTWWESEKGNAKQILTHITNS